MKNDVGAMLVAAPERWDDACFALPAVRALLASGLATGMLCSEAQHDFWSTVPDLAVLPYPSRPKSKVIGRELAGNWQAALIWEVGFAADAIHHSATPRRLGPSQRKLQKLLTHPLNFAAGPLDHRVRHYLSAVEELGVPTGRAEFFASVDFGISPDLNAVLLCPDSDFGPSHEWELERWLEIAQRLIASGKILTIAQIPAGRNLATSLGAGLGEAVEFLDTTLFGSALPQLAKFPLVIAADGSLPHLAAYAGATCVTLFGPNDPAWRRPLGKRHAIVKRHVECAPCLSPKCLMDRRCQVELDVERVWQAILQKL